MAKSDEEAVDELFIGGFDDFVGRRNELAKRLRGRGETEAAARVRELKKPSRVAWALNRLSADEPELRDRLLEAGAALRDVQERVVANKADSAELRAAGEREREAVSSALEALADEAGAGLSAAALERARQTLHSVALDADVRRDFERHRLTTDHEAAGLPGLALGAAAPPGPRSRSVKDEKGAARRRELKAADAEARKLDRRREAAERRMKAAREAAEKAQRELERAAQELDRAASEAAAARRGADDLRE